MRKGIINIIFLLIITAAPPVYGQDSLVVSGIVVAGKDHPFTMTAVYRWKQKTILTNPWHRKSYLPELMHN